jgi:hypothetical protein
MNSEDRNKRIDKQELLERIDYYETQYSGSASHFDHGIVYICRILIESIESGRFDADDSELSRLQVERDKAIEGLRWYGGHRFDDGEKARKIIKELTHDPLD